MKPISFSISMAPYNKKLILCSELIQSTVRQFMVWLSQTHTLNQRVLHRQYEILPLSRFRTRFPSPSPLPIYAFLPLSSYLPLPRPLSSLPLPPPPSTPSVCYHPLFTNITTRTSAYFFSFSVTLHDKVGYIATTITDPQTYDSAAVIFQTYVLCEPENL